MCRPISWVEKDGHNLYLTTNDIFNTERGEELRKHTLAPGDWIGHGAIRYYYAKDGEPMTGGVNKEMDDFSSPLNFPLEIAADILAGKFRGLFGTEAIEVLTPIAHDAYDAQVKPIDDAYDAQRKMIDDAYDAQLKPIKNAYYAQLSDLFWDIFATSENRVEAWK